MKTEEEKEKIKEKIRDAEKKRLQSVTSGAREYIEKLVRENGSVTTYLD